MAPLKKTITQNKVLIANRGEIAVRIIRACKEIGLKTVAIYSVADKDSMHAKLADESICVGNSPSSSSYLNIPSILAAAEISGADMIHPGYGFLAERSDFASICEKCGIIFIGPTSHQMKSLGDKVSSKIYAKKAGLPLLPGSEGVVKDIKEATAVAESIGYPIILKASGGGGGRGMKIVWDFDSLERSFISCQNEAGAAFGNPDVYIEKYIENPRHIEFQILGDQHGNLIHLGERDCSVQRRHQKVIEEAPSGKLDPKLREKIGALALKLTKEVGYQGAGTVEFLLDDKNNAYFMEMNTRIQVEHPVTEEITKVDLVRWQILMALGEKLPFLQKDITLQGHSIECRINAECPKTFAPWPGMITGFSSPGGFGVRFDSFIYQGYTVVPHYDSMIGKLIVWAESRTMAIARMKWALGELIIDGIRTNISFHQEVLNHEVFVNDTHTTGFLDKYGFIGRKA